MHDPYEAFRYVAYCQFAASYVLAIVGSQVLSSTVQWDVYQKTKDPMAIGLVGLVGAIPVILLALPAGHVADRFSRKRVLLLTQIPLTAVPLALALPHAWNPQGVSLLVTLSLVAANAVALTFARPTRASILPNLIPRSAYSMRGRVSAVNQVFIGASNELGGLESGATAKLFGPVMSVVAGGLGTLLVVLSIAGKWPQLRRLGSLGELQPKEEAPSDQAAEQRR